jgi:1,4-dihydroxy-2-naphthoate polyprenyltransferase
MKNYLLAIRPKTLTASAGPIILGLFLAYSHLGYLNIPVALITLFCTLFMQIGTNLVNDYFDFKRGVDTINRLGPARAVQSKLLTPRQVQNLYRLCFISSFSLGIFLMYEGGTPIIILGLLSLLTAYCYTGGPLPLSHFALGELLAFLFFGPVAVWGTYYLQTKTHSNLAIILGLGPGFISATIMGINNLRDETSDRMAHKKTLAVFFGKEKMKVFLMFLILFSGLIPIWYGTFYSKIFAILPVLVLVLFSGNWKRIYFGPVDAALNLSLAKTGIYLFLYGIIFGMVLIL